MKPANAMIKIFGDGSVLLSSASVEIGQGVRTALIQVAAQELSLPPERFQVPDIDTNFTPYDDATNSSSSTVIMGRAVQQAARDARQQLIAAAAWVLDANANDIQLEDGIVHCRAQSFGFKEIMRRRFGDSQCEIVGRGNYTNPPTREAPMGWRSPFWEFGVAALRWRWMSLPGRSSSSSTSR